MTCDDIERDEIAERYLLGRLSDQEREAFEAHYFDCTRCLDRLHAMEAAREALASATASKQDLPSVGSAHATPSGSRRFWRAAAALAAAAVIVLSVRVLRDGSTGDPSSEPTSQAKPVDVRGVPPPPAAQAELLLARLGAFDPPAYSPMRLRSGAADAQQDFRSAMALYVDKNYADAAAQLRRVIALPGAPIDAAFYLAVCELQTGQLQDAASAFERVIAAGESPYLEDAHFLLAKTRIRQRDVAAARTQLSRVIALAGDRREEARQLMSQLPQ